MKIAADLKWITPARAWGDIAKEIGVDVSSLYRWRQTEQWEVTFREAGAEYVETLAPAAVSALVRAWGKGNPHGALEVLRSFGFLKNEKIDVENKLTHFTVDISGDKIPE
jgi:hypothetical protein